MQNPLPSPLNGLPPSSGVPPSLLRGVRVLDLTSSIAAPYATMLLADYGAEVIKVERPGTGDDSRAWGPPFLQGESLMYLSVNRNKMSVALDFTSDEGFAILHQLARCCDVVVVNMTPRVLKKLRVDYESFKAIQPEIIYVSITGFGLTGKRADMSCYDLIAEGYSGVMDVTGEADSPPQKIGTPAADLLAGMDAVIATISALFDRGRTGKGHLIDVSLVESMTRFLTPRIVPYLGSGEVPRRTGAKDSAIAIYQSFETADLPITLGLGNEGLWKRFWVAVGDPEFGADPRFGNNADRHRHRPEIVARIASLLAKQRRSHWLELLAKANIPAGPINRVDQVAADQELISRGLFYTMQRDALQIPQVGLGVGVDGERPAPRTPPPRLGEHSDQVLRQLCNLDADAVRNLRERGVVGP